MYEEEDEPLYRGPRLWVRWVAAVVILALLAVYGISISDFFRGDSGPPVDAGEPMDPADQPAEAIACGPTHTAEPMDDGSSVEQQIAQIEAAVETLRDLPFDDRVETEFLSNGRIKQEVRALNLEGYSAREIDRDERILRAVGMIPADQGLREILDSLAGQVAGFYDPRTRRMVVAADEVEDGMGPVAELTLAHELEHALADQIFGLPLKEEPPGPRFDAELASRALIEGDATLLQQHYAAAAISPEDAGAIMADPSMEQALKDLEDIPYPVQRAFEFPYVEGLAFVCDLYAHGGWAAVDAAYEDPPETTAQVMFPERYRRREGPIEPVALGALGTPWKKREVASVGAADLLLLFQAPGGRREAALDDPMQRASGWAGGTLVAYSSGPATAVGISLMQRRPEDGLCSSMHAWYLKSFPEGRSEAARPGEELAYDGAVQDAVLVCDGPSIRLGTGPDLDTARALVTGP